MADIHELIESVRVTLASSMNPNREQLEQLHGELDQNIRKANKRLRECDALLVNGHRSEAIQLAEQDPNLLEMVAVLDFPELAEWNDFVSELGLTVTPELQIDIATDLNQTYSDDGPLEQLMRRLRLLSLARAPLRPRIDLIRKIAKRDVMTTHWKGDLKDYDKVRLRQIVEECRVAAEKKQFDVMQQLSDELTQKTWSIKPDPKLLAQVEKSLDSMRATESLKELRVVASQMTAAKLGGDIVTAEQLVQDWESLAQECQRESEEFQEIHALALPVLRWVNRSHEEDAAKQASQARIDKLERLVRSPRSTPEQLQAAFDATSGDELPEELEFQFDDRMTAFENAVRKERNLKIGGAALVGLVLVIWLTVALFF